MSLEKDARLEGSRKSRSHDVARAGGNGSQVPDGELKAYRRIDNLIVTVGRNGIADQLLASPTIGKPTHMAIGTGSTAPAAGDTALGAEIACKIMARHLSSLM